MSQPPGQDQPVRESVRRAAASLGAAPAAWHRPPFGLSVAERHVVRLDDGTRAPETGVIQQAPSLL